MSAPTVAADERLTLATKLAFGAPSFAGAAMAIPIVIHLTIFYSDVVLVPLGFVALVKSVARAFDAFTDPLMGWVSDRTRSRWGRRRPWLAIGAPLAGLTFVAMFAPPETLTPTEAAVWLSATYTLYYLFHTVYEIPHGGLGAELTRDYHERTALFGWRVPFTVAGTVVASVLPPILIEGLGGARQGYLVFAIVFSTLLALLYFHLVWRVRERPEYAERESNPLAPGVRRVMRNRAFRILLAVYVTGSVTGAIPGLMMPYFTKYVLQPDNPDTWLGIFLAIYFGCGFLCLPIWILLARRFGKQTAWLTSFVPGIVASLALFFLPGKGDLLLTAIILVVGGSAFSAGLFLGPAMQADVIDYDELYTGKRREAQYGGLWSVMTKFTVIPSMAVPLAILAAYGYAPNVPQTETVQWVIRAIFGLAPATTAILAFFIARRYPITIEVHAEILAGIDAHRRGEDAWDPLSERHVPPPAGRGIDENVGWFLDHFSLRELRRGIERPQRLLPTTLASATASLVATALAVALGLHWTRGIDQEPGVGVIGCVVVAGFSFAAFCFHVFRVRAALAMRRAPVDPATIRAHLDFTDFFTGRQDAPPAPIAPGPGTGELFVPQDRA